MHKPLHAAALHNAKTVARDPHTIIHTSMMDAKKIVDRGSGASLSTCENGAKSCINPVPGITAGKEALEDLVKAVQATTGQDCGLIFVFDSSSSDFFIAEVIYSHST